MVGAVGAAGAVGRGWFWTEPGTLNFLAPKPPAGVPPGLGIDFGALTPPDLTLKPAMALARAGLACLGTFGPGEAKHLARPALGELVARACAGIMRGGVSCLFAVLLWAKHMGVAALGKLDVVGSLFAI